MLLDIDTVFDSALLTVRHAVARPSAHPLGKLEHAAADLLLLPIAGLFARHDGPGHHVIANPSHALLFYRDQPYRISFPDDVGDESLVFGCAPATWATLLAETAGVDNLRSPRLARHCLLPAASVLDRQRLRRHLAQGGEPLAIEEIGMALLAAALRAACNDGRTAQRATRALTLGRRRQLVETVKELISLHPMRPWTLAALAHHANTSPYHLTRVFRQEVGVALHHYLLRTRLGHALARIDASDAPLTDIALDAGFANHSHFTSSFRTLFGITPSQWRARAGMTEARQRQDDMVLASVIA